MMMDPALIHSLTHSEEGENSLGGGRGGRTSQHLSRFFCRSAEPCEKGENVRKCEEGGGMHMSLNMACSTYRFAGVSGINACARSPNYDEQVLDLVADLMVLPIFLNDWHRESSLTYLLRGKRFASNIQ